MVRKIFKWTGIVIGSIIVLALCAYAFIAHDISKRRSRVYKFTAEDIYIPRDSATIARGHHLIVTRGCTDCHGTNMAGKMVVDDPPVGTLYGANLTRGKGGLPATFTTANWVMALRHGVTPEGRPLLLMPAHETVQLCENDLAAVIAYCQQLPPVDNVVKPAKVGPLSNIMTYMGKMPLLSVEMIDHHAPMVKVADTVEGIALGKYLSVACTGCHRSNLKGGDPVAPGFPKVPNITASGEPGGWTKAQFIHTLRTGQKPDGRQMKPEDMPWKMTAQYEEKELASLYAYLHSIR